MDVFDLYAKISLDSKDYDRALQNASSAAEQWKTKMVIAAKAAGTAFTSVTRSIAGLVGKSVAAYSSFEQLTGGIETLFGAGGESFDEWSKSFEQSSDSMQDYIDTARKVLNGDFGVGDERKDLLSQAGYDPNTVQQMVNNLINGVEVGSGVAADTISANMLSAEEKYSSLQRAQEKVMQYARDAFKTTGLSANDYMNTVTTFSSSLIQGLDGDTEKAAEYANRALIDMADNANKMGTDMASIQNAYQGFSKQNYTMLDNLKLGYGGTQAEMRRLIQDAASLTSVQEELGVSVDANSLSFDNIVNAISVVQQNLGITGTTSKEAATTIEGSTKMMESAWGNMLTSMATGGDWFQESLDGLIESVKTWATNIMPAVTSAMNGFAALAGQIIPYIAAELPKLVDELLPGFISAIANILSGILDAAPDLISVLRGIIPIATSALNGLISELVDFILAGTPLLVDAGITLLTGLVTGIADNIGAIIPQLAQGVLDTISQIGDIISRGGTGLAAAGLALLNGLASAAIDAVPVVLPQIAQMLQTLTTSISDEAGSDTGGALAAAMTILRNIANGLLDSIPVVIPELTSAAAEFIAKFARSAAADTVGIANAALEILRGLVKSLGDSGTITNVFSDITTAAIAIVQAIIDVITGFDKAAFADACAAIVTQLADGIVAAATLILEKLPELVTQIVAWIVNPENWTGLAEAAFTIGGNLVADVPAILEALATGLYGIVTGVAAYFKEHGGEILQGFVDGFSDIGTTITGLWEEKIKPAWEELGTKIKNWLAQFEWGQSIVEFVGKIGSKIAEAWESIKDVFTGDNGLAGKIGEWLSNIDLLESGKKLVTSIKDGISTAWEGLKTWFEDKIAALFSGIDIEIPDWLNPKNWFGGGNGGSNDGGGEGEGAETGAGEESSVESIDAPNNMITLDYDNLQPISSETIDSYQALAEAISAINDAITGGGDMVAAGEGAGAGATAAGEGAAAGGAGLQGALESIKTAMGEIINVAMTLGEELGTNLVSAIGTLTSALCITSTDEEGNVSAGNGNTLYNSLGSVKGVLEDILSTSKGIAEHWTGEFLAAANAMRKKSGEVEGVVQSLASAANAAAGAFSAMAAAIWEVIEAESALDGGDGLGSSLNASNNGERGVHGFYASGGHVNGNETIVVGEQGPELFTPSRSGYIIPNDELGGDRGTTINITFSGDVIGDEKSICAMVQKAVKAGIRQEVLYA